MTDVLDDLIPTDVWEDVKAEVAAMEAWCADGHDYRPGVNIYVGWDRYSHWYAGMSIGGEDGDEEPGQREADTPEEALRLFLAACREYRERIDRERAEEAEE